MVQSSPHGRDMRRDVERETFFFFYFSRSSCDNSDGVLGVVSSSWWVCLFKGRSYPGKINTKINELLGEP